MRHWPHPDALVVVLNRLGARVQFELSGYRRASHAHVFNASAEPHFAVPLEVRQHHDLVCPGNPAAIRAPAIWRPLTGKLFKIKTAQPVGCDKRRSGGRLEIAVHHRRRVVVHRIVPAAAVEGVGIG